MCTFPLQNGAFWNIWCIVRFVRWDRYAGPSTGPVQHWIRPISIKVVLALDDRLHLCLRHDVIHNATLYDDKYRHLCY